MKSKVFKQPSQAEMVKGDRIMFALLILAAIALAITTYNDHKQQITTTKITAK